MYSNEPTSPTSANSATQIPIILHFLQFIKAIFKIPPSRVAKYRKERGYKNCNYGLKKANFGFHIIFFTYMQIIS